MTNILPEIRNVDPETCAARSALNNGDFGGFVKAGPRGYFFPKAFEKESASIYNMEPQPGQVFVGGHPRSGTTWTQQIVWLILHDLNYAECEKTPMTDKYEFLDLKLLLPKAMEKENDMAMLTALSQKELKLTHPFMKTHLPLSLLPPNLLETSKMVYVARDPRDTVVSLYKYTTGMIWNFKGDFKSFWNFFIKGLVFYGPYFENVKEAWNQRNHPNLLFLFYEDIMNDRFNTLVRIADFFNKSYTEEQLLEACHYLEFGNLKNNKSFNSALLLRPDGGSKSRKGVIGGWREYFDEEMNREAEQWIADNLRGTDLRFPTIHLED